MTCALRCFLVRQSVPQANGVSDIFSPLDKLTNLKTLYLGINQISDIAPLRNLVQPLNFFWITST